MPEFPGFDKLFRFGPTHAPREYWGDPVERYPVLDAVAKGLTRTPGPLVIKHNVGGRVPVDVAWTGAGLPLLSERVVDLLSGFSGWSLYPVRVLGKDKVEVSGFQGLVMSGRCGPWRRELGRPIWQQFPAMCVIQMTGQYFDWTTWDGSDVFCFPGVGGGPIVSERVMRALQAESVKFVSFTSLEDVEWPFSYEGLEFAEFVKRYPLLADYPTGGLHEPATGFYANPRNRRWYPPVWR